MSSKELLLSMWGILAAMWVVAAVLRGILAYLSWPNERIPRTLMTLASVTFAAFFMWRITTGPPSETTLISYSRNDVNLFFVIMYILDALWGIKGVIERRARHAAIAKGSL